jgi:hypothetical protein
MSTPKCPIGIILKKWSMGNRWETMTINTAMALIPLSPEMCFNIKLEFRFTVVNNEKYSPTS